MEPELFSAIAEIIGAIAIIVTLAYLAIQTKQNTLAVQASTRQGMLDADREIILYLAANPEIDEYFFKPELTDNEKRRLVSFLLAMIRTRENNWLQHRTGSIDERTWVAYRRALVGTVTRCARAKNVWKLIAPMGFDQEFVDEIERMLAETEVQTGPSVMLEID